MDWTGGVRKRFVSKRKGNKTLQKQKAHFAKVRTNLQLSRDSQTKHEAASPRRERKSSSQRQDYDLDFMQARRRHGIGTAQCSGIQESRGSRYTKDYLHNDSREHCARTNAPPHTGSQSQWHVKAMDCLPDDLQKRDDLVQSNRRRLLSRSDWLGLAPRKPVHMTFSATRDKDHIGKRREAERNNRRHFTTTSQRQLTPIFQDGLELQRHFLTSGAPESVHIRIGTQALASHSQRSQLHPNPTSQVVLRSSSELSMLSEEPMLLGDDGDYFEAFDFAPQSGNIDATNSIFKEPFVSPAVGERPCSSQNDHYPPSNGTGGGEFKSLDHPGRRKSVLSVDSRMASSLYGREEARMQIDPGTANTFQCPDDQTMKHPDRIALIENSKALLDESSDAIWQRIFGPVKQHTSQDSVCALRSSSPHESATDISQRPFPGPVFQPLSVEHPSPSTTNHSIDAPNLMPIQNRQSTDRAFHGHQQKDPFSKSLEEVPIVTNKSTRLVRDNGDDLNEDETWRQFVVGIDSDTEDSCPPDDVEINPNRHEAGSMKESIDPSFILSGLGTSDGATFGDFTSLIGNGRRKPRQIYSD